MANLVVHFEIHASDPQRLIDYFERLLGWKFTQFGDAPYWVISTGEGSIGLTEPGYGINGGLTKREGPAPERGAPVNGSTIVVGVDGDIDDLYQRGLQLGGATAVPLEDMQGVGRVGYLRDPDDNVFGLISPVLSDGTDAMAG